MKIEAKPAHDAVNSPHCDIGANPAADVPARTDGAVGPVTIKSATAITKEGRDAIVEIMKPTKDRPACPLGDKAAERRVHEAYTDDMRRAFGPPPSGRTARRLFTRFLEGEAVPPREYRRQMDRKLRSRADEKSGEADTSAGKASHAWLPGVGECLLVDGSRIVAQPVEGGAPFYRLDDGGCARSGFTRGRLIAAEAELQRVIRKAPAAEPPRRPEEDVPPHRTRRYRRLPAVASSPAIGDRVWIGDRGGECIGRTLSGRVAVAMDGPRSPTSGRRVVRTYPERKVLLAPTIH